MTSESTVFVIGSLMVTLSLISLQALVMELSKKLSVSRMTPSSLKTLFIADM